MLHIDYRIAAAYTRSQEDSRDSMFSQEVFLLWEQAVSRYVSFLLPQGIPTGGYTAADFLSRHNLAQWISLLDRRMFKPILDPLKLQPSYACTGDYCRSHGPYYVGPSSAITSLRGFLTHDGGISNAASMLLLSSTWEPLIALHATSRCLG